MPMRAKVEERQVILISYDQAYPYPHMILVYIGNMATTPAYETVVTSAVARHGMGCCIARCCAEMFPDVTVYGTAMAGGVDSGSCTKTIDRKLGMADDSEGTQSTRLWLSC